jgi:MFS family permease
MVCQQGKTMSKTDLETTAWRNVRSFTLFRVFFSARFYYPVYALLFLDYGLTLGQFGLLNGIWAATIVLLEVPSGALADTIGRRRLLVVAGVCMLLEMAVLLIAPIGGGGWLFALFALNRVLSGAAEAAASGADEALAYDSLKAAGLESKWGLVLERVQRDTSLAFFFAMTIGAAVYDPQMINAVLHFVGASFSVEQSQLIKLPILLTFFSGIVVFWMALRMKEPPVETQRSVRETLALSWQQTGSAARWIWATPLPFAIILAAMVIDSVVRQFLTLASEYWNVIDLPIASYGLIGSGMALMGLFVPRIARLLAERSTPLKNFLLTVGAVFIGLLGLGFAIPVWGIVPAIFLYASIQLTGFFVSRYLNEVAPSEQRATVLSFRGLSTNFSYGAVSMMYSGLIVWLQSKAGGDVSGDAAQDALFVDSLQWFPWYFLFSVVLVFVLHRLRFGKKS